MGSHRVNSKEGRDKVWLETFETLEMLSFCIMMIMNDDD